MAREKFQTLTEPMFYILLTLREECCGTDIMTRVSALTRGRVDLGPGTLYNLLDSFQQAGMIRETAVEGRKRSYLITDKGRETLAALAEETPMGRLGTPEEVARVEGSYTGQYLKPLVL